MQSQEISSYMVFVIPIVVGLTAQIIKFFLYAMKHGWKWEYAMTHGHMPSAHTAFVVSLITSVAYYDGLNSGEFAIAFVLAFIVIDDAVRLRVYMGDQGRYLNALIKQLNINEEQFPRLKERIGHRVSEVLVGGIGGFAFAVLLIALF
jgi:uncharacterized protein